MNIKVSYDYSLLIDELKEELKDGVLSQDDFIYILRDDKGFISDWDYQDDILDDYSSEEIFSDDELSSLFFLRKNILKKGELKKVYEVLSEMLIFDNIV